MGPASKGKEGREGRGLRRGKGMGKGRRKERGMGRGSGGERVDSLARPVA